MKRKKNGYKLIYPTTKEEIEVLEDLLTDILADYILKNKFNINETIEDIS